MVLYYTTLCVVYNTLCTLRGNAYTASVGGNMTVNVQHLYGFKFPQKFPQKRVGSVFQKQEEGLGLAVIGQGNVQVL